MARKFSEDNERIKRHYMQFLREAKRCDQTTVDKAADAILRFERGTGFKPFKRFHSEQAMAFKRQLEADKNAKTGKPLSKATIDGTLRAVKAFVHWLAGQQGYKSRISYADAEYFNLNAKDARVAHAERDAPYPTMEQCAHAFSQMPSATDIERRNKALFAFLMLTGARDGAIASLRLKRVDLVEGCVYQDARDVKTKFAKTFTTWFLPVDPAYLECFTAWVNHLRQNLLFGHDDALFPKPEMGLVEGGFATLGLSRVTYANAGKITEFDPKALDLDAQTFEDYKSKYLDIYDNTKKDRPENAVSIIDEVDFELELIQRDEINVAYILALLADALAEADSLDPKIRDASKAKKKMIYDLLGSERHLRSKRELIEKFIEQHMPNLPVGSTVESAFANFWDEEKTKAISDICATEKIDPDAFKSMIEHYHFSGKRPLQGAVVDALVIKPKILERKTVVERIVSKLLGLVSTFDEGIGPV